MSEPKYTVKFTARFKKDYKLICKRGYDAALLQSVVTELAMGKALPEKNKDHELSGNWKGHMVSRRNGSGGRRKRDDRYREIR